MEQILQILSKIDTDLSISAETFVSEGEKIISKAKDVQASLVPIKQMIKDIYNDVTVQIPAAQASLEDVRRETDEAKKTFASETTTLTIKRDAIAKDVAEKQGTLNELNSKIPGLQNAVDAYIIEKNKIHGGLSTATVALDRAEKGLKIALADTEKAKKDADAAIEAKNQALNEKDQINLDIRVKEKKIIDLDKQIAEKNKLT